MMDCATPPIPGLGFVWRGPYATRHVVVVIDLENDRLNSIVINPLIYKRYVDDIFIIYPTEKVQSLLNSFNNYNSFRIHRNLQQ